MSDIASFAATMILVLALLTIAATVDLWVMLQRDSHRTARHRKMHADGRPRND